MTSANTDFKKVIVFYKFHDRVNSNLKQWTLLKTYTTYKINGDPLPNSYDEYRFEADMPGEAFFSSIYAQSALNNLVGVSVALGMIKITNYMASAWINMTSPFVIDECVYVLDEVVQKSGFVVRIYGR